MAGVWQRDRGQWVTRWQQTNPKRARSGAFTRYDAYKSSLTVREAFRNGALAQDVANDVDKGFCVATQPQPGTAPPSRASLADVAWLQEPHFDKLRKVPMQSRLEKWLNRAALGCPACLHHLGNSHQQLPPHDNLAGCIHHLEPSTATLNQVLRIQSQTQESSHIEDTLRMVRSCTSPELQSVLACAEGLLRERAAADESVRDLGPRPEFCVQEEGFVPTRVDVDEGHRHPFQQGADFVPGSPTRYVLGAASVLTGCLPWWDVASFATRAQSMVTYQRLREAMVHAEDVDRKLVCAELCLNKRINRASRSDTPTTANLCQFYRSHMRNHDANDLADLIVNTSVQRNSSSAFVRNKIATGSFPWLHVDPLTHEVANDSHLDQLFLDSGGHLFGTYVNPM